LILKTTVRLPASTSFSCLEIWEVSSRPARRAGALRSPQQEDDMAKGKLKGNKEARKPKTEKPKGSASAYKQAQSKTAASTTPFLRKVQLG
jgi:hypothetical protein